MAKRRSPGEGRVEKLPSGSWRAILPGRTRGGRSKTFPTQAEALDWLRKNATKRHQPTGTVGDWLTEWLALTKPEVAASTHRRDRKVIDHIRPALGSIPLRDLDSTRIRAFLGTLKDTGMSDSERHRVAATLRKILNAAVPDRLDSSPMGQKRVKMPSVERQEWVAFTVEQMAAFISAADDVGKGALARLWFDAGCRIGELLGLKWEDYDASSRMLWIKRAVCPLTGKLKTTKSKRPRRVLLSTTTAAMLAPQADGSLPMFPSSWGTHHQSHTNFHRGTWGKLLKAAGLTGLGLTPRSVRHSTATHLLRAGCSLRAVADRLGHRDPSLTLRVYAHVMPSDQNMLADAMSSLFPTVVPTPEQKPPENPSTPERS